MAAIKILLLMVTIFAVTLAYPTVENVEKSIKSLEAVLSKGLVNQMEQLFDINVATLGKSVPMENAETDETLAREKRGTHEWCGIKRRCTENTEKSLLSLEAVLKKGPVDQLAELIDISGAVLNESMSMENAKAAETSARTKRTTFRLCSKLKCPLCIGDRQ